MHCFFYTSGPQPLWLCGPAVGGEEMVLCEWQVHGQLHLHKRQALARVCETPFAQAAGVRAHRSHK